MSRPRKLWLVGLSHHSAPVEVRERLAFENDGAVEAMRTLRDVTGIEEGAILSTCNRVEVLACADDGVAAHRELGAFLARSRGVPVSAFDEHLYAHEDRAAVRHVFRVASSLDSLVVGEPQILGQMKQFYQLAVRAGSAGSILHRLFHKSFSVAKRIRSETGIGARNVSISSVAVDLATQIFETLSEKTAMVIGAGKMAELTAKHLRSGGIGGLMFANRTFDRAVDLARELRGTPVPFEDLRRYLPLADVVIGSSGGADFLLGPEAMHDVLRERGHRPMFLIDLAVPRNFDPRIHDLEDVYVYDLDDLESVLEGNREERSREAHRAQSLVDEEVDAFWSWFQNLDVVPTIVGLRGKAERICRQELDRTLGSLSALEPGDRRAIEAMAEAIVNKILHAPIAHLKRGAAASEDVVVARRLFGLDEAVPARGAARSGERDED